MSFKTLGLREELVRAVTDRGYTEVTPIQQEVIPVILEGRDVIASAQTGTGKTAGFSLPLLQRLYESSQNTKNKKAHVPIVRALLVTPTRELAMQLHQSLEDYGKWTSLKSTSVYGGVNISSQKKTLSRGVDILVATPGRLLDHVNQETVDLSQVEFLVLDEADRMLDMGFINDIKKILKLLPEKKQTALFSATISKEIKRLADGLMHNPTVVEIEKPQAHEEIITQIVYPVENSRKKDLLSHLISANDWQQVLVFVKTKHGADRLVRKLHEDGIKSTSIHGNKSQNARIKALGDFKKKKVRALVATDVAARGLDIDQLPHVINYELPNVSEDYVHRIGRTGRAGNEGEAISLVCHEEAKLLRDIELLLKREIPLHTVEGFTVGEFQMKPNTTTADTRARTSTRTRSGTRARTSTSTRSGTFRANSGPRKKSPSKSFRGQAKGRQKT